MQSIDARPGTRKWIWSNLMGELRRLQTEWICQRSDRANNTYIDADRGARLHSCERCSEKGDWPECDDDPNGRWWVYIHKGPYQEPESRQSGHCTKYGVLSWHPVEAIWIVIPRFHLRQAATFQITIGGLPYSPRRQIQRETRWSLIDKSTYLMIPSLASRCGCSPILPQKRARTIGAKNVRRKACTRAHSSKEVWEKNNICPNSAVTATTWTWTREI